MSEDTSSSMGPIKALDYVERQALLLAFQLKAKVAENRRERGKAGELRSGTRSIWWGEAFLGAKVSRPSHRPH